MSDLLTSRVLSVIQMVPQIKGDRAPVDVTWPMVVVYVFIGLACLVALLAVPISLTFKYPATTLAATGLGCIFVVASLPFMLLAALGVGG